MWRKPRKYDYDLLAEIARGDPSLVNRGTELARLYNERADVLKKPWISRQSVNYIMWTYPELFTRDTE